MTDAQKKFFYFPAWQRAAKSVGWQMVKGRLLADLGEQRAALFPSWDEPARGLVLRVLDYAEAMALQDHCAVTADHLRYGCNLAATEGRVSSSADLTNQELNRVVTLLALIADPLDLTAVGRWLNPELAEKESFLAFLRKQAPEGVLRQISANAFGTREFQELELDRLRWLAKQVRNGRPRQRDVASKS